MNGPSPVRLDSSMRPSRWRRIRRTCNTHQTIHSPHAGSPRRRLRSVAANKLPRALEVVPRYQDLPRAAVANSVAGACTHVRLAVIAGDSFRAQEAADRLCLHRVSDNHESHCVHQHANLAEGEHVCRAAGLEERHLSVRGSFLCPRLTTRSERRTGGVRARGDCVHTGSLPSVLVTAASLDRA
jgi:hypothetical protein